MFVSRLGRDRVEGEWRPFDRSLWYAYGDVVLSLALTLKHLVPCKECNALGVPPWHDTFKRSSEAPPLVNAAPLDAGGTPIDLGGSLRGNSP